MLFIDVATRHIDFSYKHKGNVYVVVDAAVVAACINVLSFLFTQPRCQIMLLITGVARFFNGGGGGEARERSDRAGRGQRVRRSNRAGGEFSPSHGREIFLKMRVGKTNLCTLNTIIGGGG